MCPLYARCILQISNQLHGSTPTQDTKEAAYEQFLDAYPEYRSTAVLDEVRARDFARLDEQRQVYLDYTGAGLYAASQI